LNCSHNIIDFSGGQGRIDAMKIIASPRQVLANPLANPHVPDADLLARRFTVDDPENLEQLSLSVPETDDPPVIEFAYDLTPPRGDERPFVRCAHCKYPNHWRGYVMRCADGTRFLVGKDCGAKIYGVDFKLVERRFGAQRTRQAYLRRLDRVQAAFPAALRRVGEIARSEVIGQYEAVHRDLKDGMPDLFRQLLQAVSFRAGVLYVEERVRDFAAEERRAERKKDAADEIAKLTVTRRKALRKAGKLPKSDDRPIYRAVEKAAGRLAGAGFFKAGSTSPSRDLAECHNRLKAVFHELNDVPSEHFKTRRLKQLFQTLRESIAGIEDVFAELDTVNRFFDPDNLKTVAAWATRTPECGGDYQASGNAIVHCRTVAIGGDLMIAAPAGYRVPKMQALVPFRLALEN